MFTLEESRLLARLLRLAGVGLVLLALSLAAWLVLRWL